MAKIDAYLGHARECNTMAASAASDEHRKLLQEMANTWMTLARERARMSGEPMPGLTSERPTEAVGRLPPAPPKKSKPALP
jgi:hypothetical protein